MLERLEIFLSGEGQQTCLLIHSDLRPPGPRSSPVPPIVRSGFGLNQKDCGQTVNLAGRTFCSSCGRAEQVAQPDQVVGGHRQSELESQACDPAQHGPRETTNGLGPAERLLGALALALADRITRMSRRASVDRRGSVGGVLCNVRRDVEVAQIVDELAHIVSLVGAKRRRDPGEWCTIIVWAASRSMVPVAEPSSASTTSP